MTGLNDGWKAGTALVSIERTARPYVYDLCDAYNDKRKRLDVEWIVGLDGNLHLQFVQSPQRTKDDLDRKAEAQRQEWLHRHRFPERYV
jgi:hypothetical protein